MDTVILVVVVYLLVGIGFLAIFDAVTKRIRKQLRDASYDVQLKMAGAGSAVGSKMAVVVLLFALWILWPAVIAGALTKGKEE